MSKMLLAFLALASFSAFSQVKFCDGTEAKIVAGSAVAGYTLPENCHLRVGDYQSVTELYELVHVNTVEELRAQEDCPNLKVTDQMATLSVYGDAIGKISHDNSEYVIEKTNGLGIVGAVSTYSLTKDGELILSFSGMRDTYYVSGSADGVTLACSPRFTAEDYQKYLNK